MKLFEKIASIFELKPEKNMEEELISAEIAQVVQYMKNLESRFNNQDDNDLIESEIYELCALKAKYRYLLKRAKQLALAEKEPDSACVELKEEPQCRNIG